MSSPEPPRVVFDCNIFIQALINPVGPSGECLASAFSGEVVLFITDVVMDEVVDVAARPGVALRFGVTSERLALLLENVAKVAVAIANVPVLYEHPYDPDDSHYVNLALAAGARLVVSRDRDLLNLMDDDRPEGKDFKRRFPSLEILDPIALLRKLRAG